MKYLIWIVFIYSSLIAQDLSKKRNSIILQIGEPTVLQFQHTPAIAPKFKVGIAVGILGIFKQPDYLEKYSRERGYLFYRRSHIVVLNLNILRYFSISIAEKFGFIVDLGIHNRVAPVMSFHKLRPRMTFNKPTFLFVEPIPYCQLGGFVRLGSRKQFELNIQYGLGVNVLFVPGYLEQLGSVGMGYRFSGTKKREL